jgi:predicted transcriptional regulator
MTDSLPVLTAQIVSAYVSGNRLESNQLTELIRSTHQSLLTLGHPDSPPSAPPSAPPLTPAVTLKKSVQPDHVVCLVCGKKMKTLKRHLGTEHSLTIAEYRARYGLKDDHPLIAPDYSKSRQDIAFRLKLGVRAEAA